MDKIYVGIDPGLSGGIAFLHGDTLRTHKCPTTEKDMMDLVMSYNSGNLVAMLEQVNAFPGQGVKSVWSFSGNYHGWKMLLTAMCIPYQLVLPKKWQSHFGSMPKAPPAPKKKDYNFGGEAIGEIYRKDKANHKVVLAKAKKDRKNHIKSLAQQRFPNVKITLATADAVLMAVYCKEVWG